MEVHPLGAPLWAYREPPAGLSDEWQRTYRVLVDPVTVVANFRHYAEGVRRGGTRELFQTWQDTLRRSEAAAGLILKHLHGLSPRTWPAGHEVLAAVQPVLAAITQAELSWCHPAPTPAAEEAAHNALRAQVADQLCAFNPVALLEKLAAAVRADCAALRGQQREPLLCRLHIQAGRVYVDGGFVPLDMTTEKAEEALAFLGELLKEPGNWKSSRDIGKATRREKTRFDLIFKALPEPIKSLIEPNRRKGYRLRR